jgi:hypothetical protein
MKSFKHATGIIHRSFILFVFLSLNFFQCAKKKPQNQQAVDITHAEILISEKIAPDYRSTLLKTINDETMRLAGITVALMLENQQMLANMQNPLSGKNHPSSSKAERYYLFFDQAESQPVLWIIGSDIRGLYYGLGKLSAEQPLVAGR